MEIVLNHCSMFMRLPCGDPLIGVTLKIIQNGEVVKGTITDFDGNYKLRLKPGKYDLEAKYTGFITNLTTEISLSTRQNIHFDVEITPAKYVEETQMIRCYIGTPLIDFDPENTGTTIISDQIRKMY